MLLQPEASPLPPTTILLASLLKHERGHSIDMGDIEPQFLGHVGTGRCFEELGDKDHIVLDESSRVPSAP